jgi:hypothetical protein
MEEEDEEDVPLLVQQRPLHERHDPTCVPGSTMVDPLNASRLAPNQGVGASRLPQPYSLVDEDNHEDFGIGES